MSHAYNLAPGSCVALYFQRDIDMTVSFLAVMKAGHTYLPIDTEAPPDLIKKNFVDAQVPLVLTTTNFCEKAHGVASQVSARILLLDQERDALSQAQNTNLSSDHLAEAAYVLYTSGSAGTPKSVQIALILS